MLKITILFIFIFINKSTQKAKTIEYTDYFGDYEEKKTTDTNLGPALKYEKKTGSGIAAGRMNQASRPASYKCSEVGTEIVRLLNEYRTQLKLNTLTLDPDLCFIAAMHIMADSPKALDQGCGTLGHSWEAPPTNPTPPIKWNKMEFSPEIPTKLIGYPGQAFENAACGQQWDYTGKKSGNHNATTLMKGWKNSPGHNALMANLDSFRDAKFYTAGSDYSADSGLSYLWIGEGQFDEKNEPEAISEPRSTTATNLIGTTIAMPGATTNPVPVATTTLTPAAISIVVPVATTSPVPVAITNPAITPQAGSQTPQAGSGTCNNEVILTEIDKLEDNIKQGMDKLRNLMKQASCEGSGTV